MIVIAIISILGLMAVAATNSVSRSGRDTKRQSDLKLVQSAIEQYRVDLNFYPDTNIFTGTSFTDSLGGAAATRTYISSMPTDPTAGQTYCYQPLPSGCNNTAVGGTKCTQYNLYGRLENPPGTATYTCSGVTTYNLQIPSQ